MLFVCDTCQTPLFQGREVDGHLINLEREPVADGTVVLFDTDLGDTPRAIHGGPEDLDWWRSLSASAVDPTPQDVPRYRQHRCPREDRS